MGTMNALKKYLDERGERPNAFARRTGMAQPTIWRIYRGKGVSPRIAMEIEEKTKGEVSKESLLWPDAQPIRA